MPRTTEYLGAPVTNLGPLTTTYTAPESCATQHELGVIRTSTNVYDGKHVSTWIGVAGTDCNPKTTGACVPSGAKLDELAASATTAHLNGFVAYYSPGLHCPSGWETVGVAAGSARPTSGAGLHATPTGASGVFTEDPWPYEPNGPGENRSAYLPMIKHYMAVIKDTETVVVCCPRGFKANIYGICRSKVGTATSMGVTEACRVAYAANGGDKKMSMLTSYDGTRWDPPLASATGTFNSVALSKETKSLLPAVSNSGELVVVASEFALALIYDAKDKSNNLTNVINGTSGTNAPKVTYRQFVNKGSDHGRARASLAGLVMGALLASAILMY